ncbi:EAL domain-containing protein [Vibrio fluvialis]|nr:EAL domain-containing protein [Vibrio fluvialis]
MILTDPQQYQQYVTFDMDGQYIAHYKGLTLRSVFQPIFSRTQRMVGVEALVRIHTHYHTQIRPDIFFHSDQYGLIDKLNVEYLSRILHLRNFSISCLRHLKLFLNVLPLSGNAVNQSISDSLLSHRLDELGLSHDQVVMELVELASDDDVQLQRATRQLSTHGYGIAIDDFGCQASNQARVDLLCPDIIKFDRHLLAEYMQGNTALLLNAMNVAKQANAMTVVEGIETESQLRAMQALDIDMFQGYYLGMPEAIVPIGGSASIKMAIGQ